MNPLIERKNECSTCIFIGEPTPAAAPEQPKIHPFTQEPQKVHVKKDSHLNSIHCLASVAASSSVSTIHRHHPAPPRAAHLSIRRHHHSKRTATEKEPSLHSFPNKQNHNLFLF